MNLERESTYIGSVCEGELLYKGEHMSCGNYCRGGEPLIEVIRIGSGESMYREVEDTEIIVLMRGRVHLSCKGSPDMSMTGPGIMLFPSGASLTAVATEYCEALIYTFRRDIRLCESFSLEDLARFREDDDERVTILDLHSAIDSHARSLIFNMDNGLRCRFFLQSKISELLILMKAYYPKPVLAGFFSPVLGKDMAFRNFVLRNYARISSVNEFAAKANYSRNGFARQFKRVMGKPPYQWLREEKAKLIMHDLVCSDKPIKEISDDYGFTSVPRFSEFCNEFLGSPPGKLRKGQEL